MKWLCLRHDGIKTYRRRLSFFLGMVLGEFTCGSSSSWGIVGLIAGERTYTFKNW